MLRNKSGKILVIVAVSVWAVLAFAEAERGSVLKPGEFTCRPSGAALLRGRCEYRPLPNGVSSTNKLIEKAKRGIKPINRQLTANNLEPQIGMSGNIEWWFENEDGTPDNDANQAMGVFLQENDRGPTIQNIPQVQITTMLYEFTKSQERQLGLTVGSFLGDRKLDEQPADLVQTLTNGLFKAAFGIGNPLSSYLELGISATMDSTNAKATISNTTSCEIGSTCAPTSIKINYFETPTDVKAEEVGFKMSAVPQLDPQYPGAVRLEGLSVSYSRLTGEENTPVVTYVLKQRSDTTVYTDQLLLLGSESTEIKERNNKILETSSVKNSKKFLMLIQVKVIMPRGVPNPYPNYTTRPDHRAYTEDELAALPKGQLSLSDILGSTELVCFKDIVTPENEEKLCGFRFTKLDRDYMDYRLVFHLKKGGFLGIGDNELYNEDDRKQTLKVSDIYKGKGYYMLPAVLQDADSGKFVLKVKLDKSNPIAKARRSKEEVKGIKIPFGYYKGHPEPIEFDPNFITLLD